VYFVMNTHADFSLCTFSLYAYLLLFLYLYFHTVLWASVLAILAISHLSFFAITAFIASAHRWCNHGKGTIASPFLTWGGNQCKMPTINANFTKFTAFYYNASYHHAFKLLTLLQLLGALPSDPRSPPAPFPPSSTLFPPPMRPHGPN